LDEKEDNPPCRSAACCACQQPSKNVIPDGEGSTALPISFNYER
jgi:hypothetical protein